MPKTTFTTGFMTAAPLGVSPDHHTRSSQSAADRAFARGMEVAHTCAMEGNSLTADEIAMFEMFRRERWTDEQIDAHLEGIYRTLVVPDA